MLTDQNEFYRLACAIKEMVDKHLLRLGHAVSTNVAWSDAWDGFYVVECRDAVKDWPGLYCLVWVIPSGWVMVGYGYLPAHVDIDIANPKNTEQAIEDAIVKLIASLKWCR